MTTKPKEYRILVRCFGTWRISFDLTARKWLLAYNVRIKGERWEPVRHFLVAEAAAVVVGARGTGSGNWDALGSAG